MSQPMSVGPRADAPAADQPTRDAGGWRVPQSFEDAGSYQVRDELEDIVRRDLLGPWGGPTETLTGKRTTPRDRYLLGMLGPDKRPSSDAGSLVADEMVDERDEVDASVDLDLGATVSFEADIPERLNPKTLGKLWISSMGVTCWVTDKPDEVDEPDDADHSDHSDQADPPRRIAVHVEAGRYTRVEELDDDGVPRRVWGREPLAFDVEVDLDLDEQTHVLVGGTEAGVALRSQVRRRRDRRVVTVTLVNTQDPDVTPKDATWLFQPEISLTALDGASGIFAATGERHLTSDPEDAHLAMLYRHSPAYAHGHNVAVRAERREGETCAWRLTTTWMPTSDVPQVDPQPVEGLVVDMERLAALARADDPAPLVAGLEPMVTAYAAWLTEQEQSLAGESQEWAAVGIRAISAARAVVGRLKEGLRLLGSDEQARQAFAFTNAAMARQRRNSVASARRARDPGLDYAAALGGVIDEGEEHISWRPFQLAFVLLNLPALTRADHEERAELVDLLFFPTGGGKTEAYLGLAAYTFAIRRLQGLVGSGSDARDGGAGVAVLMRYTLRLLTAQQFQRAAALVCAAEVLRREAPETWGTQRFSIGLWVGSSVSPNWYVDAATQVGEARESGRSRRTGILQTLGCPWCGEPLQAHQDLHADDVTRRIVLACPRAEGEDRCPFAATSDPDGLPILTVDEEIYRELPSLLIATVDKLAQLPWQGYAGMLFGRVHQRCPRHGYRHPDLDARIGCGSRHNAARAGATGRHGAVASEPVAPLRPPDLVIQDELHLISGALGSTVGLFEAAVEELAGWVGPSGRRTTPKIVASTATTKRSSEQVRRVFARHLATFPPQVLDSRSSFFASEQPHSVEAPGRRYLGICAHGNRLKAAEIRLAEILLIAGQHLLDHYGASADPYATIVGYFNSTRELAGMRRYLEDDVVSRIARDRVGRGMGGRGGGQLEITELTARISSAQISEALGQLGVPFDPEVATLARRAAIRAAMRESGGARPEDLPGGPRPTDVALATSMLQVGVDIGRLGLMVITGQPKNIAEYIQASSRVGREQARPGLVITLFNWTRPRDLAYYEDFEHTHATMYQRVEALSVTPYARRCLDRETAAALVAAVRNQHEEWSVNLAAQTVPLTGAAVQEVVERMLARAELADGPGGRAYLAEKVEAIRDRWREEQGRPQAPLAYQEARLKGQQYVALLHQAGDGPWTETTVSRSMRETENEINLLLPGAPGVLAAPVAEPPWSYGTASAPSADADGSP